jgi:hypothetical protein
VNPLPANEWDFRGLLEAAPHDCWQVKQCYEWEYYREVHKRHPAFQKAVNEWRKDNPLTKNGFYANPPPRFESEILEAFKESSKGGFADDPFHPKYEFEEDKMGPLWFVRFSNWPERPYLEANVWNPEPDWTESRRQGHGLQIDLQEFIHELPSAGSWEHWPAGSVLASNYESIVALHIDWARPLADIKEQVDSWLSWAHKYAANRPQRDRQGKANPLLQFKRRLKELTAMRLLENRRHKEACELYGDEDLYCDQSGWINAARNAEQHIKKLGDEWG